jgi:hypothetical protein
MKDLVHASDIEKCHFNHACFTPSPPTLCLARFALLAK